MNLKPILKDLFHSGPSERTRAADVLALLRPLLPAKAKRKEILAELASIGHPSGRDYSKTLWVLGLTPKSRPSKWTIDADGRCRLVRA